MVFMNQVKTQRIVIFKKRGYKTFLLFYGRNLPKLRYTPHFSFTKDGTFLVSE